MLVLEYLLELESVFLFLLGLGLELDMGWNSNTMHSYHWLCPIDIWLRLVETEKVQ